MMASSSRPAIFLAVTVFIAGFAVMGIELLASRLIAPALGTSVLIWTNLIGVILLALASGAWWGGKMADRYPQQTLIGALLFFAGITTLGLFLLTPLAMRSLDVLSETTALPLLALLFLAPPTFLLGSIPPAAVRLAMRETQHAGQTAGLLSALGTLGSLLGTYLTGYILIAHWPVNAIIQLIAGMLILLGLLLLRRSFLKTVGLGAGSALLLALGGVVSALPGQQISSHYSVIRITPFLFHQQPAQLLWMNNDAHAGSMLDQPTASLFAFDRAFVRLAHELKPNAKQLLQIGGGAFHSSREWLASDQTRQAFVVERDPAVIQAAKQAFALKEDPRLHLIEGDGRVSSRTLPNGMDLIFVDAYADRLTIPWHLITKEAWQELTTHLSPNGIVVMNVVINSDPAQPDNQKLLASIVNAAQPALSWSRLVRVTDTTFPAQPLSNALLILGRDAVASDEQITTIVEREATTKATLIPIDPAAHVALTDQFAPVEWLSLNLREGKD